MTNTSYYISLPWFGREPTALFRVRNDVEACLAAFVNKDLVFFLIFFRHTLTVYDIPGRIAYALDVGCSLLAAVFFFEHGRVVYGALGDLSTYEKTIMIR